MASCNETRYGTTIRRLGGWISMEWGRIKLILIVCFLILNIYLLVQFIEKKEKTDYGVLEDLQSSFEDLLEAESITIPELTTDNSGTYLSVEKKELTEDDITLGSSQVKQESLLLDEELVVSQLNKPLSIKEDESTDYYEELEEKIFYPLGDYQYWGWNKALNALIYFQKKDDRTVYFNQNGIVIVYLNDDNEAVYYTQSVLGEEEFSEDKSDLINPLEAVETLYRANTLHSGDDVKRVNLGFYTRVPYEGDTQVFAPTWKVNINDEEDYFVNAIEGFVFSTDEEEFLYENIQDSIDLLKGNKTDNKKKPKGMLELLESKLEILESGEVE